MDLHFNLVDEPWLPCVRDDGTPVPRNEQEQAAGSVAHLHVAHERILGDPLADELAALRIQDPDMEPVPLHFQMPS